MILHTSIEVPDLNLMKNESNRSEQFVLLNDKDTYIIVLFCVTNIKFLCCVK